MIIFVVRNEENETAKTKVINAYKKVFEKDILISHDSKGKPIVEEGYVSISHTDGMYIAAFSNEQVGIDVEKKDRKISSRLGSIKEWTQRESYGKFLGEGINKEIISGTIPLDLMGSLRISNEYEISICSQDKVYIVYDVI